MARSDLFVWIDLEMTGLDPEVCAIVEIATIITDATLGIVAEGPCLVIHQPENVLAAMKPVVVALHQRSGLLDLIPASDLSVEQAAERTLEFIAEHCEPGTAPLCGNSIWKDRQFLERYMPTVSSHLDYRCIDVSSIKELARRWFPEHYDPPKKRECHRALDDIRESILELCWYRDNLFIQPQPTANSQ